MNVRTRMLVYDKYGGRCAYCGRELRPDEMQVDHIVPVWRGYGKGYAPLRQGQGQRHGRQLQPGVQGVQLPQGDAVGRGGGAMRQTTTPEQETFIAENFGKMGNRELQEATGCCVPTIYRIAAKHGLRRSARLRRELCGGVTLADGQLDWLVKRYANTDNFTLADTLGVSESTLHRLARRFGPKKSRAYMRKCQREAAAAAKYFRDKSGLNEAMKGVYSENLQKGAAFQFRRGENNRQRNGDENERMRIKAGLPQKTKLKLKVV